jgi:hypothetical protein
MLEAIVELTHVRPHMRPGARFSDLELRAYHEGYYYGCVMALRVAVLALDHWVSADRWLRKWRRQRRDDREQRSA